MSSHDILAVLHEKTAALVNSETTKIYVLVAKVREVLEKPRGHQTALFSPTVIGPSDGREEELQ